MRHVGLLTATVQSSDGASIKGLTPGTRVIASCFVQQTQTRNWPYLVIAPNDDAFGDGWGICLHPRAIGEIAHIAEEALFKVSALHLPVGDGEAAADGAVTSGATTDLILSLKPRNSHVAGRIVDAFKACWNDPPADSGASATSALGANVDGVKADDTAALAAALTAAESTKSLAPVPLPSQTPEQQQRELETLMSALNDSGAPDVPIASLQRAQAAPAPAPPPVALAVSTLPPSPEQEAVDALSRILTNASEDPRITGGADPAEFRAWRLAETVNTVALEMAATTGQPVTGMGGLTFVPDGSAWHTGGQPGFATPIASAPVRQLAESRTPSRNLPPAPRPLSVTGGAPPQHQRSMHGQHHQHGHPQPAWSSASSVTGSSVYGGDGGSHGHFGGGGDAMSVMSGDDGRGGHHYGGGGGSVSTMSVPSPMRGQPHFLPASDVRLPGGSPSGGGGSPSPDWASLRDREAASRLGPGPGRSHLSNGIAPNTAAAVANARASGPNPGYPLHGGGNGGGPGYRNDARLYQHQQQQRGSSSRGGGGYGRDGFGPGYGSKPNMQQQQQQQQQGPSQPPLPPGPPPSAPQGPHGGQSESAAASAAASSGAAYFQLASAAGTSGGGRHYVVAGTGEPVPQMAISMAMGQQMMMVGLPQAMMAMGQGPMVAPAGADGAASSGAGQLTHGQQQQQEQMMMPVMLVPMGAGDYAAAAAAAASTASATTAAASSAGSASQG